MLRTLHIVAFDVPYPANYGGVIDVFYKLSSLHAAGIKIILHCYEYGRGAQPELEKYCGQVHYYKRDTSLFRHAGALPYIVASRRSAALLKRLQQDDFPVLFEGLHTCGWLQHPSLAGRVKIFRESNIEHEYYAHLAASEKSRWKKMYFRREAAKLKAFEPVVASADLILPVSQEDTAYFLQQYPSVPTVYLPSFHVNMDFTCKPGKGEYILYHGNLGVSENRLAAEFLMREVFSKISCPVIIAGLHPPESLLKQALQHKHIQLVDSPDEARMQELIANAHVHCLYTHQATGLKLKLLNVLYSGRFCLCNSSMLHGTGLDKCCVQADTAAELIRKLERLMAADFTEEEIQQRKAAFPAAYHNREKTQRLIELTTGLMQKKTNNKPS